MMVKHRWRAGCVALAAATVLTACGSSDDPAPGPPTTTTSAAPSPEDSASAAFQAYWDAYVDMANSGDVSRDGFAGRADGRFIETDLKILGDQADAGVVRVGAPAFSPYETTVSGNTATSIICVDFSPWGGKGADGQELPTPPKSDPSPYRAKLELRDGSWILVQRDFEEDLACPSA